MLLTYDPLNQSAPLASIWQAYLFSFHPTGNMTFDVRIYNSLITDFSDNQELQGNEATLIGYWKLNNTYTDSTGNTTLTTANTPTFSTDVPFSTGSGGTPTTTLYTYTYATSTNTQRQYIGEYYQAESELSYLNARWYDGERGRFLSQDPVFWEVGLTQDGKSALLDPQLQNSYSYAANNPIGNKDPSGRVSKTVTELLGELKSAVTTLLNILNSITVTSGTQQNVSVGVGSFNHTVIKKPENLSYRERFAQTQEGLIGKKYVVGGNGPDEVDCSGAIIYGIRRVANSEFADFTADGLYRKYTSNTNSSSLRSRGTLNFYDWNGDGQIDHVTTNIGNGQVVNPMDESRPVLKSSAANLETYTVAHGGVVYYGQLDWQKILTR